MLATASVFRAVLKRQNQMTCVGRFFNVSLVFSSYKLPSKGG